MTGHEIVIELYGLFGVLGWTAALSLLGGLGGGLLGGKKSKEEKAAMNAQSNLMNTQTGALQQGVGVATGLAPQAQDLLSTGMSGYAAPTDYWSKILSGDPSVRATALAPQANQISTAFSTAANNASQLSPRGGSRSAFISEVPFVKAAKIGDLGANLQGTAATNLTNIAGQQSQLGSGLFSQILSLLGGAGGGATSTAASMRNASLGNNYFGAQQGTQIGQGLGSIFTDLFKYLKGGSGGSGGSSGDWSQGG